MIFRSLTAAIILVLPLATAQALPLTDGARAVPSSVVLVQKAAETKTSAAATKKKAAKPAKKAVTAKTAKPAAKKAGAKPVAKKTVAKATKKPKKPLGVESPDAGPKAEPK